MGAFQVSGELSSTIFHRCSRPSCTDDPLDHHTTTDLEFEVFHLRKRSVGAASPEEAVGVFIREVLTNPETGHFWDAVFACRAASSSRLMDRDDHGNGGLTLFYHSDFDPEEHADVNMNCCDTPPTTVWGEVWTEPPAHRSGM